ncbi:hypothetical protein AURDEDRAFT_159593 [Auricularia subglabra TFB-10046 SS5]|nr:hypothetical protein AURDEDRAFT_159593 [Auricularia subglabra TFB-10046 SS5]
MFSTKLILATTVFAALAAAQSDTVTNSTAVFMPALSCGGIDSADSCDGKGEYCCADPTMCEQSPDDSSVWGCMNGNQMMCGTGTTMCSGARGATCCQDYETCDINTGVCNPSADQISASMSYSYYVSSISSASAAAETASSSNNPDNAAPTVASPEMTLAAIVATALLRILLA